MSASTIEGAMTEEALVALTTLTGLPTITPWRLRRLCWHHPPTEALELLRAGAELHPMVHRQLDATSVRELRRDATAACPGAVLQRCDRLGVDVVPITDPRYPPVLRFDPAAPVVLFVRGDLAVLDQRRVGIIGTRNATAAGRATAAGLGADLAQQGVTVVSGLARGIDGAAHRGVRRARAASGRPVGVVANGLDRPYPRQHTELWRWVAERGVLLSEWAPGFAPEPWRFPLRNRVLAALSEILVVVESRERGGSLITVDEATKRSVPVMIVPGAVNSRASKGTNQLLGDGAGLVTDAADVLVRLGIESARQGRLPFDPRPSPTGLAAQVFVRCQGGAQTVDMLVTTLGCSLVDAALAAARLVHDEWLIEAGGWFEPAGSRLRVS